MPPTPSRVLSGFAPFLAALLLHTFNATVSGQDTSGATLSVGGIQAPPPPTVQIVNVSSGSIGLVGGSSSGGSYTLVGGSSSGGTLIIGTPPYTPPPPLPPLTLLSVNFFGASGATPLNTTLFSSPGYAVVGPGQLSVQGATITWGYISEGNNFLLGTPYSAGYGTTFTLSGSTLVLDGNFLAASGSTSTIPDSVLASGAVFSSIIVIQPPVVQPPPVTPPPVTEPPVTQPPVITPPTTEPPATQPPVTQPPVVQPPVVVQPPQPPLPPPNQPPVTINPRLGHGGQTPLTIQKSSLATDPDGDALNFTVTASPGFGSVSIEQDTIVYTPAESYQGGDIFKVQCNDGRGGIAESTIVLTNPFVRFGGNYFGIVPDRGALYLTVDRFGTGTFKLHVDGYRAAGVFNLSPTGPTNVPVSLGSSMNPCTLTLEVLAGEVPTLQGTVDGDIDPITFVCVQRVATQVSASRSGQYNIALAANVDLVKSPFGFAIVQVASTGGARITGRLPNGKAWSAASVVDEIGELALQTSIPRFGSLGGMINLYSGNGELTWVQPNGSLTLSASGARFEKQTTVGLNVFGDTRTLAVFNFGSPATSKNKTASLLLARGGEITTFSPQSTSIRIDGRNKVAPGAAAPPLVSMKVTPDGRFSGTYATPKARGKIRFSGILQSSAVNGVGVITSGHGGYVLIDGLTLTPPTSDPTASGSTSDTGGLTKTGAGTLVIAGSTASSAAYMSSVGINDGGRTSALLQLLVNQSSAPPQQATVVTPTDAPFVGAETRH